VFSGSLWVACIVSQAKPVQVCETEIMICNWLQVFRRQKLLAAVIRETNRGIRAQGGQKNA